MNQQDIYKLVSDAINGHELDCRCYICRAFLDAPDGSRGHAAACAAASERMNGGRDEPTKDA